MRKRDMVMALDEITTAHGGTFCDVQLHISSGAEGSQVNECILDHEHNVLFL